MRVWGLTTGRVPPVNLCLACTLQIACMEQQHPHTCTSTCEGQLCACKKFSSMRRHMYREFITRLLPHASNSPGVLTLGSQLARRPLAAYSPAARLQAGGEPLWGSSHQESIAQARGSEAVFSRGGRSPLALPPFPEASLCSRARNASNQHEEEKRKIYLRNHAP